jgi:glycine cleavage system H protein
MKHPANLRYTRGDLWLREEEGGQVTVGATAWKQDELGEVVYIDLPEPGAMRSPGQALGVIESVKSVSEIEAPLEATITSVNEALFDEPSLINADPYGRGWIAVLTLARGASYQTLSHHEYEAWRGIKSEQSVEDGRKRV